MPAAKGPVTGLQVSVYIKAGHTTPLGSFTNANALLVAGNLLGDTVEVSPITRSARSVEFFPFGATVSKKIAAGSSLESITVRFVVDYTNTLHAAVAGWEVGQLVEVLFLTSTGTTARSVDYVRGQISGTAKNLGSDSDPQSYEITIDLDADPQLFHAA